MCHVVAEDAPEVTLFISVSNYLTLKKNLLIKNIVTSIFPEQYAARLAEANNMKSDWMATLPIFFYNDVMSPGQILSLHLFEPRYKVLYMTYYISNSNITSV